MKLLICTQVIDINHPILGFFHGWVEEFAKHFDEVHIICLQKGEYHLPAHVHVYSLGKEEGENKLKYVVRFYTYFSRIFFSIKVDFVFFHMGAIYNICAAPFYFLRKLHKTKFYWWKAHGHINAVGKFALMFVDRVYTSTESGFPIKTSKRRIVGQAIAVNHFVQPESGRERKTEIIFVGRIMPVKHIEDLIQTAKILSLKNPSLVFKIYGPIGDQKYFEVLQTQIRSLGLEKAVFFMGIKNQEELVSVYQQATFFLNTSLTHSMDKTVLEAVLCGCIPVTGNKAFADLLEDKELYLKKPTPESYESVLTKLMHTDTKSLQNLLRERVVTLHSLDTFSSRIFNI